MDILIVSGFLGAGKTTFIKTLTQKSSVPFAVMENEYGDTGIDGSLLEQNRLKIWELTEGCICCSLKSDFASSILTIANTVNPPYLVVEPTGVGLLSGVINNIKKITYERIRLLEPVTIVDIHSVDDYIRDFGSFYTDQIIHTKKIILSKTENSTAKEIARISEILRTINPDADITTQPYAQNTDEWWKKLIETPYNRENTVVLNTTEHELDLEQIGFTDISCNTVQDLMEICVAAMRGAFGTIYRIKGYCAIDNQWNTFNLVDKQYDITTSQAFPQSRVVIIGKQLQKEKLQTAFNGKKI